jgi:hypothetical protein
MESYSSSEAEDDDAIALFLLLKSRKKKKLSRRRRNRTIWTKSWIGNRVEFGAYHCLLQELRNDDPSACRNFLRMDWLSFTELLSRVSPRITRQDTNMRQSIKPEERLALTLRWLATGLYCRSCRYGIELNNVSERIKFHSICDHVQRRTTFVICNKMFNISLHLYTDIVYAVYTGDSFTSLQYAYRIGRTTVGEIVIDTCEQLVESLKNEFLKV